MAGTVHVAPLTAPGRSALAVIGVWGDGAAAIVEKLFQPVSGKNLADYPYRRIAFGHWRARSGEDAGEELIVTRLEEHRLEIHCHGGTASVDRIVADLSQEGCQVGTSSDWLKAQEKNRLRCEAAQFFAQCRTQRSAAILLDQYESALENTLQAILAALDRHDIGSALNRLERLLELAPLGLHLAQPFRVVVVGATNVGKSTLVNAIAGYERCVVYDYPGTTRDLVHVSVALDGWHVELVDTAGLRRSVDPLEAAGMDRVQDAVRHADLIVLVHSLPQGAQDANEFFERPAAVPILEVFNKADLVSPDEIPARGIATSARTGQGIERLTSELVGHLVPVVPERGEAVPFARWHTDQLTDAKLRLAQGDYAGAAMALRRLLA